MQQKRHLAVILFTDIVGYTAMMQQNEVQAVALVKKYLAVLHPTVQRNDGEILNDYGDGSLCIFQSVIDAVKAALELQQNLKEEPAVPLRIGLHIGEIFFEEGKVFGDGVNVASRIQSLGQANSILFSSEVNNKIRNRPEFSSVSLGRFEFKNVEEPLEVFALSNSGLTVPKKETMTGKLKGTSKNFLKKKSIFSAIIVMLLIAAVFIYYKFQSTSKFTGKEKSIVVLPFTDISSAKENESFSVGITEDITTQLTKISDLKVIGRTTAMQYKGTKKTLKQIGEELGVTAILEGSVQKSGNEIRITAQLIDANTQEHIWADKWDREFKDIFEIQSELAQQIAYRLNVVITKDEKKKIKQKPTNNPEAYKLYLQGRHLDVKWVETRNVEFHTNSVALLEKAIKLDSNFALAYAALADTYYSYVTGKKREPRDSALILLQIKLSEKAYSLDSTLDYINYVRGNILFHRLGKYEEGYICSKRALEINPNAPVILQNLAIVLFNLGLNDESMNLMNKAVQLDLLRHTSFYFLAIVELSLNRLNDATRDFHTALQLVPGRYQAMRYLIYIYSLQNKFDSAGIMLEKESRLRPVDILPTYEIAYYYAKTGNKKEALEINSRIVGVNSVRVYLALGMKKEALNRLIEIDSTSNPLLNDYLFFKNHLPHKDFDLIRDDPRFIQLMEKKRMQYEINKKKFSIAGLLN
jgi:TolB-like protein/class 3 adenylate cyclase